MNKNEMRTLLKDLTEQKAPAGEIDLWPAIQACIPMSQPISSRGTIMKTQSQFWRWKPVYLLLAVILIGALFFALPQGRVWAQDLLRFFTRAGSDSIQAPTAQPLNWIDLTPDAPAITSTPAPTLTLPGQVFFPDCGDIRILRCSVQQIREKIKYPIQELGVIPDGMLFTGATGSPSTTWIVYDYPGKNGRLLLIQEPWNASPEQTSWKLGASAVVETVKLNQVTGEYVKGSFIYSSGETQQHWDSNADVQVLRWEADGIFTVIEYVGDDTLNRDDLVALAASLTTEPVSARTPSKPTAATPTEEANDRDNLYPLTFQEAADHARQVDWNLFEPTRLPDFLSFNGASVETLSTQPPIITLSYRLNPKWGQPDGNGMLISEQIIPTGDPCRLCGFVVGQYSGTETASSGRTVGANATIITVKVGTVDGQYVEGVWKGTDQGWVYDPDPYIKTLRWQANGIGFEITYFGMEITQEYMIAIAESIK